MDAHFWLEMFGYMGSLLVAISLMMRSLLRLRMINSIGCVIFVVYGVVIHAYPVAIMNGFIILINAFYLIQMLRQKDYFQLLEVSHDSTYLSSLLDFYKKDVKDIFPDYAHNVQADHPSYLVLRNMVPAGALILQREGAQATILVDYVIPAYRDFRVAKYLFHEQAGFFTGQGINRFLAAPGRQLHAKYLERMGFHFDDGMYVFDLGGGALKDTHI
jgi:hypothetical protein